VDTKENLDEFAETVSNLMKQSKRGGLVTYQEVDVLRYEVGDKYRK